jgi:hypothetical protein
MDVVCKPAWKQAPWQRDRLTYVSVTIGCGSTAIEIIKTESGLWEKC